jgi:hypothetical protein
MQSFLNIHNQLKVNNISLFFKGYVTFELVDSIILITSNRLDQLEGDKNIRKKVYGVLTECLQNLCNHISKDHIDHLHSTEYDVNTATIMIDSDDEGYLIKTGNFIRNSEVLELKKWLEHINGVDANQIKALYNMVLTNKTYSEKGGGGLGLVDIAKRSGNKLEYDFTTLDSNYTFFSFQIRINRRKSVPEIQA